MLYVISALMISILLPALMDGPVLFGTVVELILISIILVIFDPFTFEFATCPFGWAGIIGTAV